MWPSGQDIGALDAEYYTAQSADKREGARFNRSTANELTQTTEGALSDAAINSHMEHAVRHDLLADIAEAGLRAARRVSRLRHELVTSLDNIEACGQQALSSSPSAMHPAIRAAAVTDAEATVSAFSAAATASYTYATGEAAPALSALNVRKPIPNDKDTTSALDNKGLDSRSDKALDQGGLGSRPEKLPGGQSDQTAGPGGLAQRQDKAPSGSPTSGKSQQIGSGGLEQRGDLAGGVRSGSLSPSTQPSPLSASALSGGGLPGGGGGLSSGGLGSGGLGSSSNPLSALASGMGRMPQTSGLTPPASSSALPPSGLGTGVDPASFSRAVSAGSAAAGITSSPVAPAPPLAGPSTSAVTSVGPSPVSGPSAVPAGLAGSGQHVPTSGPAMSAPGMGAPGAGGMLLPSPGLGAPAAAGGAATVPASMPAPGAPSSAGSGGGGSAVASGPTLVPAGVATPVAVSRGAGKPLSADVLSAAALTWELARAGDLRLYPMDWAVGVFRSPTGTETVVMSGDGWGYVPVGVFLPRSARLLVSDPLADDAFRNVWFGWADPARIMVEYAKLRVEGDWKLVAAATTGSADSLREAGVDHTVVNRREEGRPKGLLADWEPPVLDRQHQHRLELGYPDLFVRLENLSGVGRRYQERVIYPVSAALMECLVGVEEIPQVLRSGWHTVSCAGDLNAAEWAEFDSACAEIFLSVGAKRPGGITDTPGHPQEVPVSIHQYYRGQWVLARAMEHFGGWAGAEMPLSDMVYAAMAAERFDVRAVLAEPLRAVEEDCA